MKRSTCFALIAIVLLTCSSLSACGKKGRPNDVIGGNYPTEYPNR